MLLASFRHSLQKALAHGRTVHMRGIATTAWLFQQAQDPEISDFEMQTNQNLLRVTWKNGSTNRYPFFHLWDFCQCKECWHSLSQQRLFDTFHRVELDVQPRKVGISHDGKSLAITWPDGHVSEFEAGVLFKNRLPETAEEATRGLGLTSRPVQMWDKSFEENIPRIPFNDIMHEDEALYAWLNSLNTVGLAYIVGAPKEHGQVEKLGQRVAFVRTTVYGKTFSLAVRAEAYDLAFTPVELYSHADQMYTNYNPGLLVLHCIEQTKTSGGGSTFVDGFNAARLLKEQDPGAFRLLSRTPIYYESVGKDLFGEYSLRSTSPAITLDTFGRICATEVSDAKRFGFVEVGVDEIEEVYLAYRKFVMILREPRNIVELKMIPGDVITLDNYRVLHGRRGYQPCKGDKRILEGAYMDWDEVRSKLRVLARRLGKPIPH